MATAGDNEALKSAHKFASPFLCSLGESVNEGVGEGGW